MGIFYNEQGILQSDEYEQATYALLVNATLEKSHVRYHKQTSQRTLTLSMYRLPDNKGYAVLRAYHNKYGSTYARNDVYSIATLENAEKQYTRHIPGYETMKQISDGKHRSYMPNYRKAIEISSLGGLRNAVQNTPQSDLSVFAAYWRQITLCRIFNVVWFVFKRLINQQSLGQTFYADNANVVDFAVMVLANMPVNSYGAMLQYRERVYRLIGMLSHASFSVNTGKRTNKYYNALISMLEGFYSIRINEYSCHVSDAEYMREYYPNIWYRFNQVISIIPVNS